MQALSEKNIAILCNPLAGNGKAIELAEEIYLELSDKNIRNKIFKKQWPIYLINFTDIFIVGGDGTLNYFINQYQDIRLPLVIFNGGTGNDFHWLLYGKKTLKEQLEFVLHTPPKAVDIGKCNTKLFINGVGIGFDGSVAKSLTNKKKRPGKTSFLIAILKKIFNYRSKFYRILSAEKKDSGNKLLIGVANGRRAGGGFHIAPEAAADDGFFDVILVDAIKPFKRLKYLPVIEKGKHLNLPFIRYFKTKKIQIESNDLMDIHLDGEYYSDDKVLIEILPGKLLFRY
jgi:diacylglycerol kinase (ATP)